MATPKSQNQSPHSEGRANPSQSGNRPRCVLWHGASTELPGELLESLTRKIGRVIVCTEPYAALAEACLIDREYAEASRLTGQPVRAGGAGVLLLVQPTNLPLTAAILEAASLYAPGLQRWQYDRAANPKLRTIVEGEVRQATPQNVERAPSAAPLPKVSDRSAAFAAPAVPEVKPMPQRGLHLAESVPVVAISGPGLAGGPGADGPPRLRIAGTDTESAGANGTERARRPVPVLTEDELQILLSDDPIPPAGTAMKPRVDRPGGGW